MNNHSVNTGLSTGNFHSIQLSGNLIWGLGGVWGDVFTINIKNSPKAPYNYSASFGTSNFSVTFWETPKTPHVHDFRIWGRVHDSQKLN